MAKKDIKLARLAELVSEMAEDLEGTGIEEVRFRSCVYPGENTETPW